MDPDVEPVKFEWPNEKQKTKCLSSKD